MELEDYKVVDSSEIWLVFVEPDRIAEYQECVVQQVGIRLFTHGPCSTKPESDSNSPCKDLKLVAARARQDQKQLWVACP